jgi:hypothetical protein
VSEAYAEEREAVLVAFIPPRFSPAAHPAKSKLSSYNCRVLTRRTTRRVDIESHIDNVVLVAPSTVGSCGAISGMGECTLIGSLRLKASDCLTTTTLLVAPKHRDRHRPHELVVWGCSLGYGVAFGKDADGV